jgi:hypothetical protein
MAEDYSDTSSPSEKKHVTRFLGLEATLDGTSEQSMKDLDDHLGEISKYFNASPLGKCSDALLRVVDIFVKLVGAHSDHCSKEKKDVRLLQKKKLDAVYQTLGENEIQEQSKEDLMPEFLSSYYKMVANAGGQEVWEKLPETQKNEKLAISMEELVKKLGQDAYKRLDDEEKQYLKLFIWVGCGCHKDLNTVRGGYAALTKFWSENNLDSSILLAKRTMQQF